MEDVSVLEPQTKIAEEPIVSPVYYRSKIVTSQANHNLLVASASGLLTLAGRLRQYPVLTNASGLQDELKHEILSLETQAKHYGYSVETIRIARYILCATLDEILLSATWDEENIWLQESLLADLEGDSSGDERFFLILERLLDHPKRHMHLLELIYICLSLGFEGKYRGNSEGRKQLDDRIDELYDLIIPQLGENHLQLNLTQPIIQTETPIKQFIWTRAAKGITLLTTVIILSGFYWSYHVVLKVRSMPVNKALTTITRNVQPFT